MSRTLHVLSRMTSASASDLAPGSYWQVFAGKPEVAEAMRQTLDAMLPKASPPKKKRPV